MSIIKLNSAQCKRSFRLAISKSGAKIRKIIELHKSMEIFCKKYRMASDLTDDDQQYKTKATRKRTMMETTGLVIFQAVLMHISSAPIRIMNRSAIMFGGALMVCQSALSRMWINGERLVTNEKSVFGRFFLFFLILRNDYLPILLHISKKSSTFAVANQ